MLCVSRSFIRFVLFRFFEGEGGVMGLVVLTPLSKDNLFTLLLLFSFVLCRLQA